MKGKHNRAVLIFAVLCAGILTNACSNMNDVLRAKQDSSEGTTKAYDVSEDQAWEIAKTVFRWEGADAIEEHRDEGYMLTSSGVSMITNGTVMGAWIDPATPQKMLVTVITKRRLSLQFITSLTESTFHRRFSQALAMVKKGEKLPLTKPEFP